MRYRYVQDVRDVQIDQVVRIDRSTLTCEMINMKFNFEDLEVWNLSLELIDEIYALLDKYPDNEKFELIRQGRRSVTSVSLNIAGSAL